MNKIEYKSTLGSSDLEVYKTFVAGILQWLKLHGLLGVKYTKTQVQFLGMQLKGNASEWFTRNVEGPDRPIRDWSLELLKYNVIFFIFIERQMRPQYIYSVARSLMRARISNPPIAS